MNSAHTLIVPVALWGSVLAACWSLAIGSRAIGWMALILWALAIIWTATVWWRRFDVNVMISEDYMVERKKLYETLMFRGVGGADIFSWLQEMSRSPVGFTYFRLAQRKTSSLILINFGRGSEILALLLLIGNLYQFGWQPTPLIPSYMLDLPEQIGLLISAFVAGMINVVGWFFLSLNILRIKALLGRIG